MVPNVFGLWSPRRVGECVWPSLQKEKNTISCTHRILHTNSEEKRKENRFLDTLDLYLRSQRRDFFWELGDEKLKPMVWQNPECQNKWMSQKDNTTSASTWPPGRNDFLRSDLTAEGQESALCCFHEERVTASFILAQLSQNTARDYSSTSSNC